MNDIEYIRRFLKIKVRPMCKKYKIDPSNLYNGKTTMENIKKIREEIEDNIARLYIKEEKNGSKTDTL